MTATDPNPVPPPPPAPAPVAAEAVALCERLLAELRGEVARADSKASVLVAAIGMTAGLLSALLAGREWSPAALSAPGTALWWTGVVSLGASLLALLLAVLPRYRRARWTPGQPLSYFGDIRQAVRLGRLETALDDTWRDPVAGLRTALTEMSRITVLKHRWIRVGLISFSAGTVLLPASLLVG
jgi:hypothetical protein